MPEENWESDLEVFDYSVYSNVRSSLLQELLAKHRRDNGDGRALFSAKRLRLKRIAEADLETVAAAGVLYGDGQMLQPKATTPDF